MLSSIYFFCASCKKIEISMRKVMIIEPFNQQAIGWFSQTWIHTLKPPEWFGGMVCVCVRACAHVCVRVCVWGGSLNPLEWSLLYRDVSECAWCVCIHLAACMVFRGGHKAHDWALFCNFIFHFVKPQHMVNKASCFNCSHRTAQTHYLSDDNQCHWQDRQA